ncbi:MAG: TIGR03619 family F420-dependent LLM class oxidoreductase [Nocardiopsaceae bacterium]|nr:TIGR03619 family F420-dependent LLM class oxidoreductase [Nocardiopsaceae bacterium]
MRIGFCLPQYGEITKRPDVVTAFARGAEEIGADSLWAGDRLLMPVHPQVGYGGSTEPIPGQYKRVLDPFAVVASAAAVTSRVQFGTSVLNVPFYPAAALARTLASIDFMSGGRLIPGLGIGWAPEEYMASAAPMKERGARLDEALDVLDAWWTQDPVEHHGRFWDIPASHVDLKPAQSPRPPLYLGAFFSPAAFRRIALRGDGWLPAAVIPGQFDPAAIAGQLAKIRAEAEEAGRDPSAIGIALRINPVPPSTPADVADAFLRAADAGIDHVFADFMYLSDDAGETLDLASQVHSRVRGG